MRRFLIPSAMLAGAKSIKRLVLLLAVIAAACVAAATAHAANTRSWVSGTGSDTSNTQCSVTAPCLTFQHALTETNSGGEIDCLDPGDFGPVVITISITIDCEGKSNGGIQVSGGTDAIDVNVPGIVVNLIGLNISGNGNISGNFSGINISAAAHVNIRNCKIYNFSIGYGVTVSSGTLVADNVFLANDAYAINEENASGVANVTVRNSSINNSSQVGVFVAVSGGTHAGATIEQTTLAFNNSGLGVDQPGVAVIGGSTVVNNTYGVNGGALYSFRNNQIGGNATDGTSALATYPGGPLN